MTIDGTGQNFDADFSYPKKGISGQTSLVFAI